MTKKVDISVRPPGRRVPPVADAWVGSDATSSAAGGKLKRLTIDLDPELHARFKARCAMRGTPATTPSWPAGRPFRVRSLPRTPSRGYASS